MELKDFKVTELREAARQVAPETRGVGGLGHVGNKEQLIALLQQKGIMPGEVSAIIAGDKSIKAPEMPEDGIVKIPVEGGTTATIPSADAVKLDRDVLRWIEETGGRVIEAAKERASKGSGEDEQPTFPQFKQDDPASFDELEIIRAIITKNCKPAIDKDVILSIVDSKLKEFRNKISRPLELKMPDGEIKVVGLAHRMTERIAQVANLGLHQMLVGPAGGGKTTCAEKVAEILGLTFYPVSVGPQTTKSDLLGFVDAAGNYHTTPLRLAFENGGLLLLDEVDAANAGVLTIINSLLANGYCSFPDAVIKKNDNFRCICACNTYGRGADRMYVGRNQLDAATLDRFVVIDFDYDEALETSLAGNDEWTKKVQKWRKKAFELKMRVVISPRASIFGAKLLAAGLPEKAVEDLVVWKGVAEDIKNKIRCA